VASATHALKLHLYLLRNKNLSRVSLTLAGGGGQCEPHVSPYCFCRASLLRHNVPGTYFRDTWLENRVSNLPPVPFKSELFVWFRTKKIRQTLRQNTINLFSKTDLEYIIRYLGGAGPRIAANILPGQGIIFILPNGKLYYSIHKNQSMG
jgi:hypothetical protein